jgi:hypothetical protein
VSRRVIAALLLCLAWAAPAAAEEVTGAELQSLAARAANDVEALERLRAVDRVDGRPVDLRRALAGANAQEAADRARALAREVSSSSRAVPNATARARDVLRDGRYHESSLPRPFRRPLRWLGDRIRPVTNAVGDAFTWVADRIPGGRPVAWLLLALAIVAAAIGVSRAAVRRRATAAAESAAGRRTAEEDPAELERAALKAERTGDWEAAVRLRFRAGVARLDAPNRTTGQVAQQLHSAEFDALGGRFDAIAYGGDAAGPADADQAREGWPRVLEEARR